MLRVVMIGVMLLTGCHDITFERCILDTPANLADCHDYRVANGFVGRVSETVTHNLIDKDKYVCMPPKGWGRLYMILKEELVREEEYQF